MRKVRLIGCKRYSYKKFVFEKVNQDGKPVVYDVKDEVADYLLRQADPVNGAPFFVEGPAPVPVEKKAANRPKAPSKKSVEIETIKTDVVDPELDEVERQLAADEGPLAEATEVISALEEDPPVVADSEAGAVAV